MILASNNLQQFMDLPREVVVRVNLAWMSSADEADRVLAGITGDVFLDFPQGRSKPPTPSLTLTDAFRLCDQHQAVSFFAVSNVEDVSNIRDIQQHLRAGVEFVPKIETQCGVNNLTTIISDCGIQTLMLDKEDLYTDLSRDNAAFFRCVDQVRSVCRSFGVSLLELEGVVFAAR